MRHSVLRLISQGITSTSNSVSFVPNPSVHGHVTEPCCSSNQQHRAKVNSTLIGCWRTNKQWSSRRNFNVDFSGESSNEHEDSSNDRKKDYNYWKYGTTSLALAGFWSNISWQNFLGSGSEKAKKILADETDDMQTLYGKAVRLREQGNFTDANDLLHQALRQAIEAQDEPAITNIYEELGFVATLDKRINDAELLYRDVLTRLLAVHNVSDSHPAFVRVSLKIAEILAHRGDRKTAEIGFRHCIEKQIKNMQAQVDFDTTLVQRHKLQAKYDAREMDRGTVGTASDETAATESVMNREHVNTLIAGVDPLLYAPVGLRFGQQWADTHVLLGMCYNSYANFLIDDPRRYKEADAAFKEALKYSIQMYGQMSEHSVILLNNFATKCMKQRRYDVAAQHLEVVVDRAESMPQFNAMLSGFYCNYAEALFHSGQPEHALVVAKKAVQHARSGYDRQLIDYTETFLRDLQADLRNRKRKER